MQHTYNESKFPHLVLFNKVFTTFDPTVFTGIQINMTLARGRTKTKATNMNLAHVFNNLN